MKEKKITLPLIHALQQSSTQDSRKVLKMIKNGASNKDVEFIVDFVKQNGGIDYAEKRAREYGNAARECLKPFSETDAKQSLEMFIDFVMDREK